MPISIILRQDRAGRLTVARPARGGPEFKDAKSAENEASRMRFRDDDGAYCVYQGFFESAAEANLYCTWRNKGASIERAMKQVQLARASGKP